VIIARRLLCQILLVLICVRAVVGAEHLSPLGKSPNWSAFEKYQETLTHDEFMAALQNVYCTHGLPNEFIQVEPTCAHLLIDQDEQTWFTVRFAPDEEARKTAATTWKHAASLPRTSEGHELAGLKIALDPGHIGGRWAQMEERWYQVGDSKPVQEGDMTLLVAKLVAPKLRARGATVTFVREKTEPVTAKRPDDFREIARKVLARGGITDPREDFSGTADPEKEQTVRWQSEILFYRQSEIRARAELVNAQLKPDLVLCLHFNAEAWDDPANPRLIDHNHLHLLVNGAYLPPELANDDVRLEMLERLLSRMHDEELPLADKCAAAMAFRTHLPPYEYTTDNVTKAGNTGYVYLRNLIATRLYDRPVVYYEPYVMNSNEVFWRIQEGDYEGVRNVNGTDRASIFREYADGVVDGLVEYYAAARAKAR
jgi:hypothetical protein